MKQTFKNFVTLCINLIKGEHHILLITQQLKKYMKNSHPLSQSSVVSVLQRKKYNCFCKIFCCKCVYYCQSLDFSLLTSQNRKDVFFRMLNKYIQTIQNQPNVIIDPFFILLGLLLGQQDQKINNVTLLEIGDSKEKNSIFCKQDLQLYVPQLCTYLVFHEEMENIPIFNLLQRFSRFDIQFALLYYSYMKSLQIINQNTEFKVVMKYNKTFKRKIDQHFRFKKNPIQSLNSNQNQLIAFYNSRQQLSSQGFHSNKLKHKPHKRLYKSYFYQDKMSEEQQYGIFGSSINFLADLIQIGNRLIKITNKKAVLFQTLQKINKMLPADIYLPFKKSSAKSMKVGNIVYQQSKVFSTKMRAPYYICLEVYEDKLLVQNSKYKRIVSNQNKNQNNLRKSHLFQQDTVILQQEQIQNESNSQKKEQTSKVGQLVSKVYKLAKGAKRLYKNKNIKQQTQTTCQIHLENQQQEETLHLFGQTQDEQDKRIKMISPFSNLPKHRLFHFIVKTKDDLRQEAFAMQLLQQFNQIFQMEGLQIHVIPYQVIPLGHNCGIIQFLKDTITIDQLRKRQGNLQFIRKDAIKLKNFLNTLVAYSLVTYFLQVKDRHNGNIMIRRDGSIIHIDFGFFMSNAPGKGVELQKKVAFKMTSEYMQTLGGTQSKQFQEFRKLFYLGYQFCRKHQHRILILAKLMYSSYGTTMPCFQNGNTAIHDLQDRLNPPRMRTDGDLYLHCQNLINTSIDNWRARWYDKWQYYMQGILY